MQAPLALAGAAELLAATALTVFLHRLPKAPSARDSRDSRPQVVQRAVAFIEANLDTNIETGDIARAAFVSPRTVQLAFRRYLQTTPLTYVRRLRLDRVRTELQNAESAAGQTVMGIAARWGFVDASRFASFYRDTYGESPSQTLRS